MGLYLFGKFTRVMHVWLLDRAILDDMKLNLEETVQNWYVVRSVKAHTCLNAICKYRFKLLYYNGNQTLYVRIRIRIIIFFYFLIGFLWIGFSGAVFEIFVGSRLFSSEIDLSNARRLMSPDNRSDTRLTPRPLQRRTELWKDRDKTWPIISKISKTDWIRNVKLLVGWRIGLD